MVKLREASMGYVHTTMAAKPLRAEHPLEMVNQLEHSVLPTVTSPHIGWTVCRNCKVSRSQIGL